MEKIAILSPIWLKDRKENKKKVWKIEIQNIFEDTISETKEVSRQEKPGNVFSQPL